MSESVPLQKLYKLAQNDELNAEKDKNNEGDANDNKFTSSFLVILVIYFKFL